MTVRITRHSHLLCRCVRVSSHAGSARLTSSVVRYIKNSGCKFYLIVLIILLLLFMYQPQTTHRRNILKPLKTLLSLIIGDQRLDYIHGAAQAAMSCSAATPASEGVDTFELSWLLNRAHRNSQVENGLQSSVLTTRHRALIFIGYAV